MKIAASIIMISFLIILCIIAIRYIIRTEYDVYRHNDRNDERKNDAENKKAYGSEYEMLLDSDVWKEKRLQIIEMDGGRCRYCGSSENLQVHHKYYLRYPNGQKVSPWNYPDDAMITLCDRCHKKWHETHKIKWYHTKYN